MATYGTKNINIRFDRKNFKQKVLIADVETPILGWDFLSDFQLDLLWTNNKCVLYNKAARSTYNLTLGQGKIKTDHLGLAPTQLTFAKYSQAQKRPPAGTTVPAAYSQILAKYPGLLEDKLSPTPAQFLLSQPP